MSNFPYHQLPYLIAAGETHLFINSNVYADQNIHVAFYELTYKVRFSRRKLCEVGKRGENVGKK